MVMNKKSKSRSSQKNKNRKQRKTQRGGFAKMSNSNKPHTITPKQNGGSPASSLVMKDTSKGPVMNDYVTSPRIRQEGYDDSLDSLVSGNQYGGGIASDLVMENLSSVPETKQYPESLKVKGDINSLNLYQTTGGSRRKHKSRKHKSHKNKSRKHKSRKSKSRVQRGGSDWIASQYSLGPANNPEMSASAVGQFSQSMATSRNNYMNPSTMGLAGSGYPMGALEGSGVRSIGAPL
jgi:hypothetical protein